MNPLTLEFWSALATIVFIDLMLAGDNAIVIGMAARNLPRHQQKAAILWGMAGAVAIRITATLLVVYLLEWKWLHLIGGLLLVWIAYKLLVQEEEDHEVKAGNTLLQSIGTIILADAAMGFDNVIAIAGASEGHRWLVVIGLLISIPVVVWGSTLFIRVLNRFPWIVCLGGGVLAYTCREDDRGREGDRRLDGAACLGRLDDPSGRHRRRAAGRLHREHRQEAGSATSEKQGAALKRSLLFCLA